MRKCSKCHVDKDESEFYLYRKTGKLRGYCKKCHVAGCVARAAADPEHNNARSKAWRDSHPEQHSATVRAWQRRNPDRFEANTKRYRYGIDFNLLWETQQGLCPMQQMVRKRTLRSVLNCRSRPIMLSWEEVLWKVRSRAHSPELQPGAWICQR